MTVETNKGSVDIMVLTSLKDQVYALPAGIDFETLAPARTVGNPELEELVPQTFHVYQYGGRDFRIEVASAPDFLEVTLEPGEGPGAIQNLPGQGPTSIFDVTVAPVWSLLEPGPFETEIRIRTNDEKIPELVISVVGTVE